MPAHPARRRLRRGGPEPAQGVSLDRTRLDELDHLCHFHHSLKTTLGWQLEPGTGKRRMLAPDQLVSAGREPP